MTRIAEAFKNRVVRILEGLSLRLFGYNIGTVGKQLEDTSSRLGKIREQFDTVDQRLSAIKNRADRHFQALVKKLDHLAESIDTITHVLDNEASLWLHLNRGERMDATAELYDEARRGFHLERYRFACRHVRGKVVADIACGTGYGTRMLVAEGKACSAIGVDVDPGVIGYAKRIHMAQGCRYVCDSADELSLEPESVDAVVSFETLEHVPDDAAAVGEFYRILRPGGMLICSVPNNWPLESAPYHVRVYDRASFEALLKGCFELVELHNQNSGSDWPHNHGQPAGIVETTEENEAVAECYIAVCRKRIDD